MTTTTTTTTQLVSVLLYAVGWNQFYTSNAFQSSSLRKRIAAAPSFYTTSRWRSQDRKSSPDPQPQPSYCIRLAMNSNKDDPLEYDDDDFFYEDDEDAEMIARLTQDKKISTDLEDLSGCATRQFSLGYDVQITSFIGSSGFEEVTDWEYYYEGERGDRNVVEPLPFDPKTPKRTKEQSGSIVRLFRGELIGRVGSLARSKGLDVRILLKEFSGEEAIRLAESEMSALRYMQSDFCRRSDVEINEFATSRYIQGRANGNTNEDDANLVKLMNMIIVPKTNDKAPWVSVLGGLNLSEFFQDEETDVRNEWYRALGCSPPRPDSIWFVYEWVGLSTAGMYATPALKRWSRIPPQRGLFGNLMAPPALPPFKERAKYVIKGILLQSLQALSTLHDNGIVHRSIGRNSIIISSKGQDKQEASSPYATVISRLRIKLSDFGFSGKIADSSSDEAFRSRARTFKLDIRQGSTSLETKSFAIAEDLHAMGFVFVALLLSSLAEIPSDDYVMPPTDEDSIQRLLADIFKKDIQEFRYYCEAEQIWGPLVELLDEKDGAGWDLLDKMLFSREAVADNLRKGYILTANSLCASPFLA